VAVVAPGQRVLRSGEQQRENEGRVPYFHGRHRWLWW